MRSQSDDDLQKQAKAINNIRNTAIENSKVTKISTFIHQYENIDMFVLIYYCCGLGIVA